MNSHDVQTLSDTAARLQAAGRLTEAESLYRQILDVAPAVPEAHYNLARTLRALGDVEGAILSYRKAVELRPGFGEAWNNLGTLLKASGRIDEALAAFQKAIDLRPNDTEPRFNLGNALVESGNTGEAIAAYHSALAIRADAPHVIAALGNALRDSAQIPAALECYRRSLAIAPDPDVTSNLAYTLYLDPGAKPSDILAAHRVWDRQFAQPLSALQQSFPNAPDPDRKLRVGYVSPDLNLHPVGRFIHPLLAHHDHNFHEIFCYSDGPADDLTLRLKASADTWRETCALSHGQFAEQIRADGIDVLVDLAMHTRHNRLLTFARKPAPVQLTYLAYCGTTGLSTIDYRLTDPFLDPPGRNDEYYSKRTVRLPRTYWCFQPLDMMPGVQPPPAQSPHYVTFGYLGNFAKVSSPAIEAWLRILQSLPASRLLIHSPIGPHRRQILSSAAARGIIAGRIEFVSRVPVEEYFRMFSRIDLTLDSFPCSGATTLCDSVWMGVPVVTLAGTTAMARSGVSVLSNAGFPEFVAQDVDHYVQIAVNLASDLPQLERLRREMRPRVAASPLADAPQFARDFESAIRSMWGTWCEGRP